MLFAAPVKSVDKPLRIGVFGGTFDPIHAGHLAIARAARDQLRLDTVLFVIAANPPHKPGAMITPAETRVAMTEAAIDGQQGFAVSRIEITRPGPSYTADTLKRLHERYPEGELFFIVGYDSALDLPHWRNPDAILRLATVLVAPRPENSRALPVLLNGHCRMLDMAEYAVSSSAIRTRIEHGENMDAYLPAPVAAMIREKGLYHAHSRNAAG